MSVKLKNPVTLDQPAYNLLDGQIAVITRWSVNRYIGRIVQRYGNNLVSLGRPVAKSWPGFFNEGNPVTRDTLGYTFRCKVLEPGTELVI